MKEGSKSGQTPSRFVLLICGSGGGKNFYKGGLWSPARVTSHLGAIYRDHRGERTLVTYVRNVFQKWMAAEGRRYTRSRYARGFGFSCPSPWVAIDTKGRERKGMTRAIDPRHEWKGGEAREGGREGPSKTKEKGRGTKDSPFS